MSRQTTEPTEPTDPCGPAVIPLNAVFADDFVQIFVAVTTEDTAEQVAAAVAHHVEGKRVRALPHPRVVFHNGRRLDPATTVAQAGFEPFDHVRVEYDIPEGTR
ncbi:toluene-4-monooxygenase system B family protein [Streptomyces sp. NPDC093018]|uniref:toluene-4-monooxygenase system B family protein n=1 Tax=Streptomyces sp. NPDC093018 TaxID=3155067 RepID=UPI003425E12B